MFMKLTSKLLHSFRATLYRLPKIQIVLHFVSWRELARLVWVRRRDDVPLCDLADESRDPWWETVGLIEDRETSETLWKMNDEVICIIMLDTKEIFYFYKNVSGYMDGNIIVCWTLEAY